MASARVGGADVYDHPFTIAGADLTGIEITLTRQASEIAGTVTGPTQGDPNAIVVAFPADVQTWIGEGMLSRRLAMAGVAEDGSYRLSGLRPGDYAVVAVPAAAPIEPRSAGTIVALAGLATRTSVGPGETRTQALTVSQVR